ncbi:MAG: carboxypeptidase-like regulatory domain-containing protein, partial [Cyclobacteriaceae bacterium]|nr:carboxypeptidase-like regulatory domain-containing protein [Cyclobacteriaceae bacterium]
MKNIFLVLISIIPALSFAQEGVIKGRIFNPLSNESIPFATVAIQGTSNGAVADMEGIYELNGLVPGLYNLEAASVGFEGRLLTEIQVTNARPAIVDIALKESATRL